MFGNSTSSRSASAMVRSTPPGVGPGRYEQPSFKVEARSGESVAGFSAFLGPERACNKKTITSALGPGSHRPELYTAMVRPQSQPPPRIATAKAVRRPMLAAREEIRQRGTTPSIRAQTATGFIYEETPDGQLRPIDGAPNTRQPPPELPSPFSYSPLDTRIALAARHVDFSRSAGRTSKLSGTGGPPDLMEGAPDWHDGTNANPLPNRNPEARFHKLNFFHLLQTTEGFLELQNWFMTRSGIEIDEYKFYDEMKEVIVDLNMTKAWEIFDMCATDNTITFKDFILIILL